MRECVTAFWLKSIISDECECAMALRQDRPDILTQVSHLIEEDALWPVATLVATTLPAGCVEAPPLAAPSPPTAEAPRFDLFAFFLGTSEGRIEPEARR